MIAAALLLLIVFLHESYANEYRSQQLFEANFTSLGLRKSSRRRVVGGALLLAHSFGATDFVGENKTALVTCLVNASTVFVVDVGKKNVTLATNATTLSAAVIAPEDDRLLLMW
jgi:hypothetical protein